MHAIPEKSAVLTIAEMYAADKMAVSLGVESLALMEAAGAAVARTVETRWRRRSVTVMCGPGNNGGDGFVAARILAQSGWPVQLGLAASIDSLRGDAATTARLWREVGAIQPLSTDLLEGDPLVVDALFGAGLSRSVEGPAREIVARVNANNLSCLAVDVPSGVNGDTGEVLGLAPRCAVTVTFFRPKPGHLLFPAREFIGDLTVADIGIPDEVLARIAPKTAHNTPALWQLPQRSWSDHKYDRGYAIVVGGGAMPGAARLAARAARRAGAGLLRMAVPPEVVAQCAADAPGAFVQALAATADLDDLFADPRRNGVLFGPGAGVGATTRERTRKILGAGRAVVLDADALTSFEANPKALLAEIAAATAPIVLTPHDGEFRRLFPEVVGSRLDRARRVAALSGAVVVLKGADTVVAAPDGRAAIASNAPSWLATGGTGDVLAGLILGLLVQRMPAWEAACAAVWIHGEAGRRVGRGLIAEDLPEAVPSILAGI